MGETSRAVEQDVGAPGGAGISPVTRVRCGQLQRLDVLQPGAAQQLGDELVRLQQRGGSYSG